MKGDLEYARTMVVTMVETLLGGADQAAAHAHDQAAAQHCQGGDRADDGVTSVRWIVGLRAVCRPALRPTPGQGRLGGARHPQPPLRPR